MTRRSGDQEVETRISGNQVKRNSKLETLNSNYQNDEVQNGILDARCKTTEQKLGADLPIYWFGRGRDTAWIQISTGRHSIDDGQVLCKSNIQGSAQLGLVGTQILHPRAVGLRYAIASERGSIRGL
ncbi:MAG: hypothetical protein ACYTEL_23185 [Planctomycetota bacterium]